eukprot:g545.t1
MSKRAAESEGAGSVSKRAKDYSGQTSAKEGKFHYAMICSSNMNRSCAGHKILKDNNLKVSSYGAGAQVKIPGFKGARVFPFGTPYDSIYKSLESENEKFYKQNGMLDMNDRNRNIKKAPERWQDSDIIGLVDVAVCFEERVYELVEEDLQIRESVDFKPLHIVNIETKDNPKAAAKSAELALELCQMIEGLEDLEDSLDDIVDEFQEKYDLQINHNMHLI